MKAYYKVSIEVNSLTISRETSRRSGVEEVNILIYLQVAMKVTVNNFDVLRIECCILNELSDTFSSDMIMRLDDRLIRNIAAEIEESQIDRTRTIKKLNSLETGLQTLNRLNRNKAAGW